MTLDDFWVGQDWATLGSLGAWSVERQEEDVFLALQARDEESYRIRIRCSGYPKEAPSVKFVDQDGSENARRAWPRGVGWVTQIVKPPPSCFLCTDLTREGLQHHQDWASRPTAWSDKKSILDIINLIVRLLRCDEYLGRAG